MAQTLEPAANPCQSYTNYLNTELAPKSRHAYDGYLTRFMAFVGAKTHDDLIYDPATGQQCDQRVLTAKLESYILHLKSKGLQRGSVLGALWALKFFYEASNQIALPWAYLARKAPRETGVLKRSKIRAYTKDEIRAMLEVTTDPRDNALTLILTSTGMRCGAFEPEYYDTQDGIQVESPGLFIKDLHRVSDLLPDDEPEYEQLRKYKGYLVVVYANTHAEYFTFTTPEAAAAIDAYIAYRESRGETVTADSPLIRDIFDARPRHTADRKPKPAQPLATIGIATVFKNLQIKTGMRAAYQGGMSLDQARKQRHEVPAVHGFRHFASTVLQNAKLHPDFKHLLLGHDTGLDEHYYDYKQPTSVAAALTEYLKAVDNLTTSQEVKLQAQVAVLKQKADKVDELGAQIAQMLAQLQELKGAAAAAQK